eukprot:GHVU01070883.1.p2 GENE.GHVU01070883.1~~GHVU01070883.1.p2  ORF type:complete len:100 (+),score=4.13 GHVU01070883.1:3-302(+)
MRMRAGAYAGVCGCMGLCVCANVCKCVRMCADVCGCVRMCADVCGCVRLCACMCVRADAALVFCPHRPICSRTYANVWAPCDPVFAAQAIPQRSDTRAG